jgi:hypothetical protein
MLEAFTGYFSDEKNREEGFRLCCTHPFTRYVKGFKVTSPFQACVVSPNPTPNFFNNANPAVYRLLR